MAKRKRRTFTPEFKATVVLEAENRVEKLWMGTYKWQISKTEIKVIEG